MTFATRHELEQAKQELRAEIRDTERQLRKETSEAVKEVRAEIRDGFKQVDEHLSEQDRYIMRRRFQWSRWRRDTGSLFFAALLSAVVAHFFFGVG